MASLSVAAVAATIAMPSSSGGRGRRLRVASMATQKGQKPTPKTVSGTRRSGTTTVFPVGEPGPRPATTSGKAPVKLLTNVEKLRLLTKAERAGLLSAAERAGLSLSAMERLGLLSKLEELGALSAATDPGTPGALLALALPLLAAGPAVVYLVPEEQAWQVALQAVAALVCVVGGAAAVAASTFVSRLQGSSS
ncbi:uncharacterized protein LOC100273400 [Zea mays]|nr:uncharacterized protein LOC100273400 [Zea mays]ACF86039.1 unknown [Zea mays]ONM01485.1 hypothetical protein ZEAMMB73_Zm00001d030762 [Zea mays]|eukprot:NP_001141309.1 uncharacterized protein LOC100273400 [Zea mays]